VALAPAACHIADVTTGGMMPILPSRGHRPRHAATRTLVTTGLVAAQTVIAVTLFTMLAGRAEGAPPLAAAHASTTPTAQASARRRLRAPRQLSPAARATVKAVPSFSWARVRGAVKYEFQLSADPAFKSIVLGQGKGSFQTLNTFGSVDKTLADGDYFWRVRAIDKKDRAGRWSRARRLSKIWSSAPTLRAPVDRGTLTYPRDPLVLRWDPLPYAYKYLVQIATDPALAHSALGDRTQGVETSGTSFVLPGALAPGRYYWAVTPLDSEKHRGVRSAVSAFDWSWPTNTTPRVTDLNADDRVYDPQFSWDPVAGAAQYQVEINPSEDFAIGSRVCCDEPAMGTSLSPLRLLPNNNYYWRVRALDVDGNAGSWNTGPSFRKDFDDVAPTIPGMRLRDNVADAVPPVGPSALPTTATPVIQWDPVPGASSYEVNVAPWAGATAASGSCNWTTSDPTQRWTSTTATTAWTPLSGFWNGAKPLGNAFPKVAFDGGSKRLRDNPNVPDDGSYCVRVRARSDRDAANHEIVSEWTQLGGSGSPAFTYLESGRCGGGSAVAYQEPQTGSVVGGMPLLTWEGLSGACGYYVIVARDPEFTDIVDVALTAEPAYAPRSAAQVTTYADETTSYYWVAMPTAGENGSGLTSEPRENNPQSFHKRSAPPQLLAPAIGADVPTQPSFRWTASHGARQYRIQVADDPTFGTPIVDVLTNSTAYTSISALPADTVLYWRVRSNDENKVGLTWSAVGTFRRRLPIPALAGDNPLDGERIPVLSWSPVEAAVSYDIHVEQADGTKRDFKTRSTAFAPVIFYGTGIWHWQVRANFKAGAGVVSGGYSDPLPFTRRISTPAGIHSSKAGGGALLAWDPALMARRYSVQLSTSDSFSKIIERALTDNTSYAPKMINPAFHTGQPIYWRVAVVDEGANTGGFATSPLRNSKPMRLRLRGSLRQGRARTVRATVKDARGRAIRGAQVSVTGGGLHVGVRRTTRRGRVSFRLRPGIKGKVRFQAEKPGFRPTVKTISVR
jgi:hypothetical protein